MRNEGREGGRVEGRKEKKRRRRRKLGKEMRCIQINALKEIKQ